MEELFTPAFYRQLQQLKIHTRRAFLGTRQGGHRSARKGHGLEFADFRQYAPGDDFRHIDWGVYGRTDRLYVRQFREEQDLNVLFLIDASASMAHPETSAKFDLARNLALSIGYVALTDGDSIRFSLLGQRSTPRYAGPQALARARRELRDVEPRGVFSLPEEIRAAVARQHIPGKVFVLSDFFAPIEEIVSGIEILRAKNFDITLLHILSPEEMRLEIEPGETLVVDAESGAEVTLAVDGSSARSYATLLADHVDAIEEYCRRAEISHLLLSSDETVVDVVLTRLPELGLLT